MGFKPYAWAAFGAGLTWIASGILAIIYQGEHEPGTTADYLVEGSFAVGVFLTAVALVGIHSVQVRAAGLLGGIGFYGLEVASAVQVLATTAGLFGFRAFDAVVFPALLLILVGFILFALGTWRARVWPRWLAVGLGVALPVAVATGLYGGNVLFGLFWLAVGWQLMTFQHSFAQNGLGPTPRTG